MLEVSTSKEPLSHPHLQPATQQAAPPAEAAPQQEFLQQSGRLLLAGPGLSLGPAAEHPGGALRLLGRFALSQAGQSALVQGLSHVELVGL